MKKKGETKRKRIIIYYALAIVLPCLILGVLAFRGIKNDQALVEREQRRDLLETGQEIIGETEASLSSVENSFAGLIESASVPDKPIFTDSLLIRFIDRHKAVKGIFFISGNGNCSLLNNGMLYLPDDFLSVTSVSLPLGTQDILDKGWQYEFRENDDLKALKYYQNALPSVTGNQSRGEILNAVARLQKKLKLEGEAIKTYDRIQNEYPHLFLRNKFPFGATAMLEKSLLYQAGKDTIHALENILLLLSQLKKASWELGYPAYSGFRSKTDEIISLCPISNNTETRRLLARINTLKDSLSTSEKHTASLLAFLDNSKSLPPIAGPDPATGKHRYKLQNNGESCFCSVVPANNGRWGLIMDQEYILSNDVYHSMIRYARQTNFYWEVTDAEGGLLLRSEQSPEQMAPVHIAFPSDLPPWTLKLFPAESGLFASLFHPQKGIFLYIFIVIVIILVCGLFFTLQTVNNELNLSRMKSNFMSTVSHEFKSPLTSIRQLSEMLVRDRVPSRERKLKYYTTILQQSERLSHLIENILDFTKMEEGHKVFRFETADISSVVKDIVELFRELTAGSGFQINLAIPDHMPEAIFDREAMEQVIYNLIDNAVKYSRDLKVIEVQLTSEDNRIIIRVMDYGIGIMKEDREKIFSRFYRAGEELSQNVKGSGIGLAIVKQIVEAHHGEITVESEFGKGSTFIVRIPVKRT